MVTSASTFVAAKAPRRPDRPPPYAVRHQCQAPGTGGRQHFVNTRRQFPHRVIDANAGWSLVKTTR